MGPVCMRKAHHALEAAVEASTAQGDLFAGELVTANLTNRVQSLLARLEALEAKRTDHA